MKITIDDYFGDYIEHDDALPITFRNADVLLRKVNRLLTQAEREGVPLPTPLIYSEFGGFRPMVCTVGEWNSPHKSGNGICLNDPDNALDNWLTDGLLEEFDLYREVPGATPGWCALCVHNPGGGRTFIP